MIPPQSTDAALVALEQRVAVLERASRTTRIDMRDSAGTLRVRVGDIDGAGRFGVRVWNSAGALIYDHTGT